MLDNLDIEIFKFQSRLEEKGLSSNEAQGHAVTLRTEITAYAIEAIDRAVVEMAGEIVDKGAKDAISELRPNYDDFRLDTESGRTDFTVPPFPMRDNLLKNAKVSKNGVRYKVIPVGKHDGVSPFAVSMEDVQRAQSKVLKDALAERVASKQLGSSSKSGGPQEYRTVTDKQSETMWQHPGFNRDFTETLNKLNNDVRSSIEGNIRGMMARYEENL